MLFKQAMATDVYVMGDVDFSSYKEASTMRIHQPHPDCIYLRTRAIGNLEVDGPNANADAFPYGEFLNDKPGFGYKSFIGKKAFIEHQSDSVTNAIGDLIDSYLREFSLGNLSSKSWFDLNDNERLSVVGSLLNRDSIGKEIISSIGVDGFIDNQSDGSIEVLMKIDRSRAPKIARQIDIGEKVGVSMGTAIAYSECSLCGNKAYYEKDYCSHIAYGKGRFQNVYASDLHDMVKKGTLKPEWLKYIVSSPNDVRSILTNQKRRMVSGKAFEINYGLQFYELSVVGNPAFDRGYMLEKVANSKNSNWLEMISNEELLSLYASLE